MTFESEKVRADFHLLQTQTQYDWTCFEESLAKKGEALHILLVEVSPDGHEQVSCSVSPLTHD